MGTRQLSAWELTNTLVFRQGPVPEPRVDHRIRNRDPTSERERKYGSPTGHYAFRFKVYLLPEPFLIKIVPKLGTPSPGL